jgi:CelD/BcsL family acetyltransferase involved in cellulose biosynthesis
MATTSTTQACPAATPTGRRHAYPDLGAVITCDELPKDLAGELPRRYSSCFCVAEYFDIYDRPDNVHTCQLEEPRHVVAFTVKGATAVVLNKVVDIEPAALERVTAAIFRERPEVHRIEAEVKFPPDQLTTPHRCLLRADDYVVALPADQDGYDRLIGNTTRKHLRQYGNGLRRRYPDFALSTIEREEIPRELVDQVIAWHLDRMHVKGVVSLWEDGEQQPEQLWRLLRAHGCALCGSIAGRCVAAQLLLFVGDDCWVHTVGFDRAFEDVHLGLLMTSYSIGESIRRGCARIHLTWGSNVYKQRLGAQPVPAFRVSIYRSRLRMALHCRERLELLVAQRRDIYWRSRVALSRRLPFVARLRARGAASPDGAAGPGDCTEAGRPA